ncbi:Sugar phosphate isomerase/epimerase [Paenibacillus sp. 1_12]|uniref:sugar phosphate isomerase/epimerase family protein n=1 Tax=Paenibacillus sp. 1_12 TaxID=1566278 RepID=UPI0008EA5379|nr:sugar phosphate isomerase/epimerase family protein [Paenibacillus sp. 1_12]SFL43418.1 Sugar phosphate isomerase/epimerase [Paenibacillus sp. 1_12]
MKIALSAWSCHQSFYDKTWTNADFIDFAATTGADGVELLSMFWNPDSDIEPVREALRRNSLKLACFGASNNLAQLDEKKRKEQIQDICLSVDMAVLLGAEVVRVFSGDKTGDMTFEQAKDWILDGLREAAAYAGVKGVTLCLENHGLFAGKVEQVSKIITEVGSPYLRNTFDTGNFLLVDEQPNVAINQLIDLVTHVHLKDFKKITDSEHKGKTYSSLSGLVYGGQVPGEGDVDLPFVLSSLKHADYSGWLSVEYEGNEDQKLASARSISNLAKLLEQL